MSLNTNVIIQAGDHLENKKRVLPLALQLQSRGYNPIVLVYKKKEETFFLHHGIDSISLENYQKKIRLPLFFKRNLINRKPELSEYKEVVFRDVFSVELQRGKRLTAHWKNSIVRHVKILRAVLEDIKPVAIFVWNGHTGICANTLRSLCKIKNIKDFYMERSLLKEGVFFDEEGVNGFSSLCNKVTKIDLLAFSGNKQNHITTVTKAKKAKCERFKQWRKIIFLPLQVQADTNILLFSANIKTMRSLVLNIYNAIPKDTLLVVRHHPEEVEKQLNLPMAKNIMYSNEESLHYWINISDLVITINSTVGFEALLIGSPVLTFGKSIYSGKELCTEVHKLEELPNALSKESTYIAPDIDLVQQYANYLIYNHTALLGEKNKTIEDEFPQVTTVKAQYFNSFKVCPNKVKEKADTLFKKINCTKRSESINVGVSLDASHTLNLTYRNNSTEINRSYIETLLRNNLRNKSKLNIDLTKKFPQGSDIKIIVSSRDCNLMLHSESALVIDKYGHLHPSNFNSL